MANSTLVEARLEAITELLKNFAISDQQQLVKLLKENFNIETNQAVVSRDLRKLKVIKKVVNGVMTYDMPDLDVTKEILRLALVDITHNESLIVIKTHPGLAAFVGDCVDQYSDLEVLGCLAGENVVFVTPKSTKAIQKTYENICKRFHFKKQK